MSYQKYIVQNVQEYISRVFNMQGGNSFRGVSNKDYKLIPGIGRYNSELKKILVRECYMMVDFRNKLCSVETYNNFDELIVMAQHYGLPTRLLDWTTNPLVALYFSVASLENKDNDGAVYIANMSGVPSVNLLFNYEDIIYQPGAKATLDFLEKNSKINSIQDRIFKFFQYTKRKYQPDFLIVKPKAKTRRVIVQDSFFVLHMDPTMPFDEKVKEKIIIKAEDKKNIKKQLEKLGIHAFSLFPECEGLCKSMKEKYFPE